MRIEPRRVLDVGVGFGRWGIIVREFCDVWFGRVLPEQWSVYVEGIEAFAPSISSYHSSFYNKIWVGDAVEVFSRIDKSWDVVIFGDVLEHFTRENAEKLLLWSVNHSNYVIVNIPIGDDWDQGEMYGNPYEQHRSVWVEEDFHGFFMVRRALFNDYLGRKHGSFVLSRHDPRGVALRLFSERTDEFQSEIGVSMDRLTHHVDLDSLHNIVERTRAISEELESIKNSRSYQAMVQFRRSPIGHIAAKTLRYVDQSVGKIKGLSKIRQGIVGLVYQYVPRVNTRLLEQMYHLPHGIVRLRLIGKNPHSQGAEAWILAVRNNHGFLSAGQIRLYGSWTVREGSGMKGMPALVASEYGWADIPAEHGAHLVLLRHPWSGIVELQFGNVRRRFDLYASQAHDIIIDLTTLEQKQSLPTVRPVPLPDTFRRWLETTDFSQGVVTVVNPEWRGIYSSTKNLFDTILELPDHLDEASGLQYAWLLAETRCQVVVIQGFPMTYYHLVTALRRIAPNMRIAVIWHGTFLQLTEDYVWQSFRQVERFCREGAIWKLGFVKARMAEIMAKRGIRTGFVQNMVREVPDKPSEPLPGGPHIGVWLLYDGWLKNPFTSIAAVSALSGATLHMSAVSDRVREFAEFMNIRSNIHFRPIDQGLMRHYLAQMHLNLYVTLSECAPMLPLESLSVGSPCLFGPTTYYFDDHDYLRERLVVPQPDDAGMIAAYMQRALEERGEIIAAYARYAPDYNRRARATLAEFLELDGCDSAKNT